MKSAFLILGLMFCCIRMSANAQVEEGILSSDVRDSLLMMAQRWDLPQPAAGSRLVKIWVYGSETDDFYVVGFIEAHKPESALVGFDYWDLSQIPDTQEVLDVNNLTLENITSSSPFASTYEVNLGLLTGIQLIRDGKEGLGNLIVEKSLSEEAGRPGSPFYSPGGENPVLMLARSCLAAWLNEITSANPDYQKIKNHVELLISDQPKLRNEAIDFVIEALEANVAHRPGQPGTLERVLDNYLLSGGKEGATYSSTERFSEEERALILEGFKAVPILIAQRQSKRFSNHAMQGFNNFLSYPMTAGQVINAYLQRLANDELGSNWLERQKGYVAEDEAVLAWWQYASELGEENYVRDFTVVVDGADGITRFSDVLLLIAQERYPEQIPDLYQKFLTTSIPSWEVADVLAQSNTVGQQEKIGLFEAAIATNDEAHRNIALRYLGDLDPDLADMELIRLLGQAPKTPEGEYWGDQDAYLSGLVSGSSNPLVWKALLELIDRADLGMRMELIDNLSPPRNIPDVILRSFYSIYDRFCDEATIRDESSNEKFSGPGAGFPYDIIEFRDFIHMHWAKWLDLSLRPPDEGAFAGEWEAYRNAVGLAVREDKMEKGLN